MKRVLLVAIAVVGFIPIHWANATNAETPTVKRLRAANARLRFQNAVLEQNIGVLFRRIDALTYALTACELERP